MLQVLALAICAAAVVTDLRGLRIPNTLTVPAMIAGLLLDPSLAAPLGGLFVFVVFGVPAAFDKIGMGDVKLAVAVAMLLRWPMALPFVLYTALAGGLVALVFAACRRRQMPYALAIAGGCVWAVLADHAAQLRLL